MSSKQKKIIFFSFLITILVFLIALFKKQESTTFAHTIELNKLSVSSPIDESLKISNAKEIDVEEVIKRNTVNIGYREEIKVINEELEYITKYVNDSNLYIGTTQTYREGRNGTQAITIKKIFDEKGKLIKEEQVLAVVVKASVDKEIHIGTKKKEKKKAILGSTDGLNFNMALNKPSGFTLEQFTEALTDNKDKYNTFKDNAKYFYYIEKQYNINGIFVASVGIHESAWGTSKIARNKYNLFGYGAYDSNPYNGAYKFENYGESIDLISRVLVKYYLNPKGTSIYGGETANGKYYSGNTLTAVNKKYATDKQWANGVYTHMKYLYNKIKKN